MENYKPASILIVNDYDTLRELEERWANYRGYKNVRSIPFQKQPSSPFNLVNLGEFDTIYLEVQHGERQAAVRGVSYSQKLREAGYSGGIVLAVNYFPDAVRSVHEKYGNPANVVIDTSLTEAEFNQAIEEAYRLSMHSR